MPMAGDAEPELVADERFLGGVASEGHRAAALPSLSFYFFGVHPRTAPDRYDACPADEGDADEHE